MMTMLFFLLSILRYLKFVECFPSSKHTLFPPPTAWVFSGIG